MEPDRLADELGVRLVSGQLDGSRSGARVRRGLLRDGRSVVLKVIATPGAEQRVAAARELRCYRSLRLPLRTPSLLAWHEDEDVTALVLTAGGRALPAAVWEQRHWAALAVDLAALHSTPIPDDWPGRAGPRVGDDEIAASVGYWRGGPLGALLRGILDDPSVLLVQADQQHRCFGHGDCHTDNVLLDGGGLVWVDWQQAGPTGPSWELAFPAVRATPSGVVPPMADLLGRYAVRRGLDLADLARSVLAAELWTWLYAWPPFAAFQTPAGERHVHRRVAELARRWLVG